MGLFFGILLIVTAIVGIFFVMLDANAKNKQQENANKMQKHEEDKLAKIKDLQARMEKEMHDIKTAEDYYNQPDGSMKVKKSYIDNHLKGFVTEDVYFAEEDQDGFITMTHDAFIEAEAKRMAYEQKQEKLNKTAELNNRGIEFEKAGNIEEAIKVYEQAVKMMYPATHAYDRLIRIYRQKEEFNNEKRICAIAAVVFKGEANYQKYNNRYNELVKLLGGE